MNRKHFVRALTASGLVLAKFAWPALAQTARPRVPRIGVLAYGSPKPRMPTPIVALQEGLRSLGYVDGRTIRIEYAWAEGRAERLPGLATALVADGVELIVAAGDAPARAARTATSTVPIVMATSGDAVGAGFVASLARPGGNVTGMTAINPELAPKRLQLLKELAPAVSRVGVLLNPADAAHMLELGYSKQAATRFGLVLTQARVQAETEVAAALLALMAERIDALIIFNDTITVAARPSIVRFAARHRLPAIYEASEWVDAGGLVSYGVTHADLFRQAATYVDRILKGAKPADLPVEQASRIRMVVNLEAARELGIMVPQAILARADKLLE